VTAAPQRCKGTSATTNKGPNKEQLQSLANSLTKCRAQVYTELRREAGMTHAMPVAVRHLESMIRMSEAHARMHLRDAVEPQDIDIAIRLMLESFVQARRDVPRYRC
jgi:DNA replicative helicase MCM subunit Mcm2 (Cdc46/Mcm family)